MFEASFPLQKKVLGPILWGGQLVGAQNLPENGPAVFVANHADALGPIAITVALPIRLKYWMIADDVDKDLAAAYLQKDFVERQLHFKPPFSRWFSQMLSRITVPYLTALGSIPVYLDNDGIQKTLQMSLEALRAARCILVFPENPFLPADPATKMNPFREDFAWLGAMYHAETGKCLEFYPLAVHPKKYVLVGRPAAFNPDNPAEQERRRLCTILRERIKGLYLLPEPLQWDGSLDDGAGE